MVKEYEVKLKFDSDIAAENTYMALATAVSMLRSFAANPARFRNNYLETFTHAEARYAEVENVTPSEAADWTHTNLEIFFANLQQVVFAAALAMESEYADSTMPVERDALLVIDGHAHESIRLSQEILADDEGMEDPIEMPEELRKQLEAIFGSNGTDVTERN